MKALSLPLILLAASLVVTGTLTSTKDVSAEEKSSEELVLELIDKTNTVAMADTMMQYMTRAFLDAVTKRNPKVTDGTKQDITNVIREVFHEEIGTFKKAMVKLYSSHYNHDELKALVAFYDTPLGVKVTRLQPTIAQQSMAFGRQWGQSLTPKVQARLEEVFKKHKEEGS